MQALRSLGSRTLALPKGRGRLLLREASSSSQQEQRPMLKRVRHIMVNKDKGGVLDDLQRQLEGVNDLSKRSVLFADLAKANSECVSAKQGGDLGWLQRYTYFPSFEEVVQATQVGSMARATTPRGQHLLQVEGERPETTVQQMSVQDLAELIQNPVALEEGVQFVDVREPWEFEEASLPRFKLLPLSQAPSWMPKLTEELDPSKPTVCLCHHGIRSMNMSQYLVQQGFEDVSNVVGGIDAYSKGVDPSVPEY